MSAFVRILQIELGKAIRSNPWFWAATLVGIVLALGAAGQSAVVFNGTLAYAQQLWSVEDVVYSAATCFRFWMVVDPYELLPGIFMILWPLLAAIPYAWSWRVDRSSGMLSQQAVRVSKGTYMAARACATFVAGALAVAVPVLVNLIACACVAPATLNWVSDIIYTGVTDQTPFSSLFYTAPWLFCLCWTLVAALVSGLWATTVLALSMLVDGFLSALIGSYLALHLLAYIGTQLAFVLEGVVDERLRGSALLSFDVLSVISARPAQDARLWLALVIAILAVISAAVPFRMAKRDVL